MAFPLKVAVFIIASAGLFWVSWPSLRDLRLHGFYRFFALESILIIVLLNIDYWFTEPLSLYQIISWFLLLVSVSLVVHGFWLLRFVGKPDRRRRDAGLVGIEKTTELVTEGAYRYIRHPIYASGLYGVWGVFMKNPSWAGALWAVIATFFLILTARVEEVENMRFFGDAYEDYRSKTKMFIPFLL